jgi:hypothetical protein
MMMPVFMSVAMIVIISMMMMAISMAAFGDMNMVITITRLAKHSPVFC